MREQLLMASCFKCFHQFYFSNIAIDFVVMQVDYYLVTLLKKKIITGAKHILVTVLNIQVFFCLSRYKIEQFYFHEDHAFYFFNLIQFNYY